MEIFYVCGLCVSEFIGLCCFDLYFDIGFVKVVGKGNKERVVLIGEAVIKYIKFYLEGGWWG